MLYKGGTIWSISGADSTSELRHPKPSSLLPLYLYKIYFYDFSYVCDKGSETEINNSVGKENAQWDRSISF